MGAVDFVTNSIYVSTNSGATWDTNTINSTNLTRWGALAYSADGNRIAVAGRLAGLIYFSSDHGFSWNLTSAPQTNYTSIACSADGIKWLATGYDPNFYPYLGALFISTNSGTNWAVVNVPETAYLSGGVSVACSADFSRLIAVSFGQGGPGLIYISTNSGVTWTTNSAFSAKWGAVASSADGSKLVAAVYGGGIFTRHDPAILNIQHAADKYVLSWKSTSYLQDFVLQQNQDLAPANWSDVNTQRVLTNGSYEVILPHTATQNFYRLRSP
jgi:photosystem II stability/assembly factor-like uncharacterized protein